MVKCNTLDPNIQELGCVLSNILQALFIFIGFVATFSLLTSGIKLATSQGDPKALAAAKARFTWAILGFILAIGAVAAIQLIGNLVGYPELTKIEINTDLLRIN